MPSYRSVLERPNFHEDPIVGDKVECWLFNIPDGRSYGERWIGEVLSINYSIKRSYHVTRPGFPNINVTIKEIWKIVKENVNG